MNIAANFVGRCRLFFHCGSDGIGNVIGLGDDRAYFANGAYSILYIRLDIIDLGADFLCRVRSGFGELVSLVDIATATALLAIRAAS